MLGFLSVHHPFIPVASFSSTIGNFHIPCIFKKINKNKNKNKGVGGEEGEVGMGKDPYERKEDIDIIRVISVGPTPTWS